MADSGSGDVLSIELSGPVYGPYAGDESDSGAVQVDLRSLGVFSCREVEDTSVPAPVPAPSVFTVTDAQGTSGALRFSAGLSAPDRLSRVLEIPSWTEAFPPSQTDGTGCFEGTGLRGVFAARYGGEGLALGGRCFFGTRVRRFDPAFLARVSSAGEWCFARCRELDSLYGMASFDPVAPHCFSGCVRLEYLQCGFSGAAPAFGEGLFEGCAGLRSLTGLPALPDLGDRCFRRCASLRSLGALDGLPPVRTAPPTPLKAFGAQAFEGCTGLVSLGCPGAPVASFGGRCFADCTSLKRLDGVPETLGALGRGCFAGCTGLVDASALADVARRYGLAHPGGVFRIPPDCFNGDVSLALFDPWDGSDSESFPPMALGDRCFRGCAGFPDLSRFDFRGLSVPAETSWAPGDVGEYVFAECFRDDGAAAGIRKAEFRNAGAAFRAIPKGMFYGCAALGGVQPPPAVMAVGDHAFDGCSELRGFDFGGGGPVQQDDSSDDSSDDGPDEPPMVLIDRPDLGRIPYSVDLSRAFFSIGDFAFRGCSKGRFDLAPVCQSYIANAPYLALADLDVACNAVADQLGRGFWQRPLDAAGVSSGLVATLESVVGGSVGDLVASRFFSGSFADVLSFAMVCPYGYAVYDIPAERPRNDCWQFRRPADAPEYLVTVFRHELMELDGSDSDGERHRLDVAPDCLASVYLVGRGLFRPLAVDVACPAGSLAQEDVEPMRLFDVPYGMDDGVPRGVRECRLHLGAGGLGSDGAPGWTLARLTVTYAHTVMVSENLFETVEDTDEFSIAPEVRWSVDRRVFDGYTKEVDPEALPGMFYDTVAFLLDDLGAFALYAGGSDDRRPTTEQEFRQALARVGFPDSHRDRAGLARTLLRWFAGGRSLAGESAFEGCRSVGGVRDYPDGQTVRAACFRNVGRLGLSGDGVEVFGGVLGVEAEAFRGVPDVKGLDGWPYAVTNLASGVFRGCSIGSLRGLPDSVLVFGASCLAQNPLKDLGMEPGDAVAPWPYVYFSDASLLNRVLLGPGDVAFADGSAEEFPSVMRSVRFFHTVAPYMFAGTKLRHSRHFLFETGSDSDSGSDFGSDSDSVGDSCFGQVFSTGQPLMDPNDPSALDPRFSSTDASDVCLRSVYASPQFTQDGGRLEIPRLTAVFPDMSVPVQTDDASHMSGGSRCLAMCEIGGFSVDLKVLHQSMPAEPDPQDVFRPASVRWVSPEDADWQHLDRLMYTAIRWETLQQRSSWDYSENPPRRLAPEERIGVPCSSQWFRRAVLDQYPMVLAGLDWRSFMLPSGCVPLPARDGDASGVLRAAWWLWELVLHVEVTGIGRFPAGGDGPWPGPDGESKTIYETITKPVVRLVCDSCRPRVAWDLSVRAPLGPDDPLYPPRVMMPKAWFPAFAEGMFAGCRGIRSLDWVPRHITSFPSKCFAGCGLKRSDAPPWVTDIADDCFDSDYDIP